MSKKILRITKGVPRPNDVTTYGRHALTPRLAKIGYTTYALTMNPISESISSLPLLRSITKLQISKFDKNNDNLIWILPPTIRTGSSFVNEIIFCISSILTILFLLLQKRISFDVIYSSQTFFFGLIAGILKIITKKRWIAEPSDPRSDDLYRGIKGKILLITEKIVFFLSPDYVFAVDPVQAKQYSNKYKRKVTFFPLCYDDRFKTVIKDAEIEKFRKQNKLDGKIVILFAGLMHPHYNRVDILSETAKKVCEAHDNIQFLIVAHNKDGLNLLKKRIKEFGIENRFVFIDWMDHDEIPLLIKSCDISLNINYLYNISTKITEGMIMNRPTISAAPWFDQYDEFLKTEHNTILTPLDPNIITEKILQLTTDQEYREKIAKNGYKTIKPYDWDYENKLFVDLFFHQ